jgi:predicted nucleic acid-binding protein
LPAALAIDHAVHDCLYLALSEGQDAPLVTADRRLIAKAKGTRSPSGRWT